MEQYMKHQKLDFLNDFEEYSVIMKDLLRDEFKERTILLVGKQVKVNLASPISWLAFLLTLMRKQPFQMSFCKKNCLPVCLPDFF